MICFHWLFMRVLTIRKLLVNIAKSYMIFEEKKIQKFFLIDSPYEPKRLYKLTSVLYRNYRYWFCSK